MAFSVSQSELEDALQEGQDRIRAGYAPDDTAAEELNEQHLVDYVDECVKESFEATKERREMDEELWRAHENDFREFQDKEDWQSKIVINKPWTTSYQATSIVRRGMIQRQDYFDLTPDDEDDPGQVIATDFWRQALRYWTTQPQAKLQYEFADSAQMGFAIGISQFIKWLWKQNEQGDWGLETKRFEAWKQYADPDRLPRKPWSGLYAIHEEWVDLHELQELEAKGVYQNVSQINVDSRPTDHAGMYRQHLEEQREEERRRSGETALRNRFRKGILVREFWGTLLDAQGRLLKKNVTYTVAGNQVIRAPQDTPFPGGVIRWPWSDFSPLPHPIRYHGYGLYEGVLAVWKLQCQLLNLYLDNENFRINNMYEIDPFKLRNPADDEIFPGKKWIRKSGADAGPAIQPVLKGESNLADVQFMWSIATNLWENGSFVTEFVKGEQGTRRDITATEVQAKTQQALGVFDSIGSDTEDGIISALHCAHAVLRTFWYDLRQPAFRKIVRSNPLAQAIAMGMMPEDRMRAMALSAKFRVSGVSKAFERAAIITQLRELATIGAQPLYQPYVKHFNLIRNYAEELNKPDLVLTEQEFQKQQQEAQAQQIKMAVDQATNSALEQAGMRQPSATAPPRRAADAPQTSPAFSAASNPVK